MIWGLGEYLNSISSVRPAVDTLRRNDGGGVYTQNLVSVV